MAITGLRRPPDRFPIRDKGLLELDGYSEPAGQALDEHLQVDFALPRHDRLADLVVYAVAEGGVLAVERGQPTASLSSSPLERRRRAP